MATKTLSIEELAGNLDTELLKFPRETAKSARQALNRSVSSLRKASVDEIKKRRRLKSGDIKKNMLRAHKARGSNIDLLEAELDFLPKGGSLMRFIKGRKTPRNQKKIKDPTKRAHVFVEIRPGKKRKTKTFIAKGTGGKFAVFRRTKRTRVVGNKKRQILAFQSVPTVSTLLTKKSFSSAIDRAAARIMKKEFDSALRLNLAD